MDGLLAQSMHCGCNYYRTCICDIGLHIVGTIKYILVGFFLLQNNSKCPLGLPITVKKMSKGVTEKHPSITSK